MEQNDVRKTEVSPPKSNELKAIAHFTDKVIDRLFADYYKDKDICGSIDIGVENVADKNEHSFTLYARKGYQLEQHSTRTAYVNIDEHGYAIKIHAAVEDRKHRESKTVAAELTKDIADAILKELG